MAIVKLFYLLIKAGVIYGGFVDPNKPNNNEIREQSNIELNDPYGPTFPNAPPSYGSTFPNAPPSCGSTFPNAPPSCGSTFPNAPPSYGPTLPNAPPSYGPTFPSKPNYNENNYIVEYSSIYPPRPGTYSISPIDSNRSHPYPLQPQNTSFNPNEPYGTHFPLPVTTPQTNFSNFQHDRKIISKKQCTPFCCVVFIICFIFVGIFVVEGYLNFFNKYP